MTGPEDQKTFSATKTCFASPERDPIDEIKKQSERALQSPIIQVVLRAIEGFVLILNEHRQILAGNQEVLEALGVKNHSYLGLRPGELFACKHAKEGPSGCGTSMHCKVCGAVIAILAAQDTKDTAKDECRMTIVKGDKIDCRDFKVHVAPVTIDKYSLLIFILQDISSAKRREVLERVFLHDINNIVSGLMGWSHVLKMKNSKEAAERILKLSEYLSEELINQSALLSAERGDLIVRKEQTDARRILDMISSFFTNHELTRDKELFVFPMSWNVSFTTDISLLMRVLINMVKNALEATPANGSVQIYFEKKDGRPSFSVHNAGVMPESVALNIFNRSFSTKAGTGRGVGTYSMKLYGEQYLGGTVTFSSTEEHGTVFSISLPKE